MSKKKKPSPSIIRPPSIKLDISKAEIESLSRIDYPLFSFKYLKDISYPDSRDVKFFISFIRRLTKLSNLGWSGIQTSDRHSFGTEKIDRDIIKPEIPAGITPDVQLYAIRAAGDNHPFIGFREGKIFHILFIEASFGDIYNH